MEDTPFVGVSMSPKLTDSKMNIDSSASDLNMHSDHHSNGKNSDTEKTNKIIKMKKNFVKSKKDSNVLYKSKIKKSSSLNFSTKKLESKKKEKREEINRIKSLNIVPNIAVSKRVVKMTIALDQSDVDNTNSESADEGLEWMNETIKISPISIEQSATISTEIKDLKASVSEEKSIQDLYYYDNFDLEFKAKQKKKRRLTKYVCKKCGKMENDLANLRVHIRVHTGERPYPCHLCPKRFIVPSTLRAHIRTHTGETPYVCHICGRCFASSTYFYAHQRSHTDERPYKCIHCPKTFKFSSNLKGHLRRHTGDKPYICQVCSKSFAYKTDLNAHLRMHTGERPFVCNLCQKAFSQRGNLSIHILTHSGERNFQCDKCDKAFMSKGCLDRHNRIHTGEKRFECNLCKKRFAYSNTLAAHKIMHTGNKDYHCLTCDKKYARLSSLIAHRKKHKHLEGDMNTKETANNDESSKNVNVDSL